MAPTWQSWNTGLTPTQYALANRFVATPSGACYCGYINIQFGSGAVTFLARAPSLGGTWEVLYDPDSLSLDSGFGGVCGLGYNPLLPDTVGIVLSNGAEGVPYFWLGTGGTFVKKGQLSASAWTVYISYGLGKWMCSAYGNQPNGNIRTAPADGSVWTVQSSYPYLDTDQPHVRASTTGKTFHVSDFYPNVLRVGENNFATTSDIDTGDGIAMWNSFGSEPYFACDPSGKYMMCRWGSGARGRSSDFGATWTGIPNLPFGNWWFQYAGPGENGIPRFVAAGGSSIRYSDDFGETWLNKEGNLTSLIGSPDINMIKILEY